ncbi:MAG: GNAT family N-acetyltransferase [Nitrososphaerales archaeon]
MPPKTKINFKIREIKEDDLGKGFFKTLSNLAEIGEVSKNSLKARKILQAIKSNPLHKIFVAVSDDGEVIGLTTLLIEQKFIHDGGKVAHIEDVVTRKEYQGLGIGSALIHKVLKLAKERNCYKVILDCSERNVEYYEKLGFKRHSVSMRYDLK